MEVLAGLSELTLSLSDFSGGLTDFYVDPPQVYCQKIDNFQLTRNLKPKTRPGSVVNNDQHAKLTSRVPLIFRFKDIFWRLEGKEIKYDNGASLATLACPNATNDSFLYADATSIAQQKLWNEFSFLIESNHSDSNFSHTLALYKDSAANYKIRTLGLPESGDATLPAGAAGTSYGYAFVYRFAFTVQGGRSYAWLSTPHYQAHTKAAAITGGSTVAITVPTLANSGDTQYKVASAGAILVDTYRTTDNGQTYYLINSGAALGAAIVDNTTDAALILLPTLYTTGDVLANDLPPPCKYFHTTTRFGYAASIQEAGANEASIVRQSKDGEPWSMPGGNNIEVDDIIAGVSSARDIPIILGENSIFRIEGSYDIQGNGNPQAVRVASATGCVSASSIVQAPNGIYFAGVDGFYFTDGYQVLKISETIPTTYKTLVSTGAKQKRIVGAYNELEQLVYWAVNLDSSTDNDTLFVYHAWLGLKASGCFTTWSGRTYDSVSNFSPTALTVYDGKLYRFDSTGYLFRHADSVYTDSLVQTAVDPDEWDTTAILYNLWTAALSFGDPSIKKWVYALEITAQDDTNMSLQLQGDNDNQPDPHDLGEVYLKPRITWGDPTIIWGDPDFWNVPRGTLEAQRKFPSEKLRATYKQVRLTNSSSIYTTSSKRSLQVEVDVKLTGATNTKVLTLPLGNSYVWPVGVVGSIVSFVSDGYVDNYTVTARTSSRIITISDPTLALTAGRTHLKLYEKIILRDTATATGTTTKNVVLDEAATYDWPEDVVGYSLSFASDDYFKEYVITSRTDGNTVVIADADQTAPTTSSEWRIVGYIKGEALHLLTLSINYMPLTSSQAGFHGVGGVEA